MDRPSRVAFLLACLVVIGIKSFSQTISQLSFVAPLISTFDMDYINDHVIITQQKLLIYDVTDPANPDKVGSATYPGDYAYQVTAEGNRAYMGMGNGGIFAVYDISDFTNPSLTGSVPIPATSFTLSGDIIPFGNHVFLAGFDSLYVINVSDSSAPFVISKQVINDPGFSGSGAMGLVDSTLLITTPIALQIFDVSDPASPAFINSLPNSHSGQKGIAVDTSGKRIFLPWVNSLSTHVGYDAVDISNPLLPALLFADSTTFGSGDYGEVTYYNNILIISKGGGVNAFDASPFNHHFVTSFTGQDVANSTVALDIRDSIFYNARGSGLEVLLYEGGFPTAINEISHNSKFQLYPNPVAVGSSYISFILNEAITGGTMTISNALGEEVSRFENTFYNTGVNTMALPLLSPGIYIITIQNKEQLLTADLLLK